MIKNRNEIYILFYKCLNRINYFNIKINKLFINIYIDL